MRMVDEDTWGSFAPVSYVYDTPFKEKERPSLKALTSHLRFSPRWPWFICLPALSPPRGRNISFKRHPHRQAGIRRVQKADSMIWTLTPMGVLLLTLPGLGFHPCLCQVWQGLLAWNWSWGKKSGCFFTQMPKCPMCMKKTGRMIRKVNVLDMLSLMMLPLRQWKLTWGASTVCQHKHFTSVPCQVSFTAITR